MDPGSGGLGEIDYPGLPGNTFGVATMVGMDEASKPKSGDLPTSSSIASIGTY